MRRLLDFCSGRCWAWNEEMAEKYEGMLYTFLKFYDHMMVFIQMVDDIVSLVFEIATRNVLKIDFIQWKWKWQLYLFVNLYSRFGRFGITADPLLWLYQWCIHVLGVRFMYRVLPIQQYFEKFLWKRHEKMLNKILNAMKWRKSKRRVIQMKRILLWLISVILIKNICSNPNLNSFKISMNLLFNWKVQKNG